MSYINLLPPNATKLEKACDKVGSLRLQELKKTTYDLFPLTCNKKFLPHLAYIYSLDISNLSEDEIRELIGSAFDIKRHQGTVSSLQKALESISYKAIKKEWYEYGAEPYHFMVDLILKIDSDKKFGDSKFKKMKQLIEMSKNARSVFDYFNIKLEDSFYHFKFFGANTTNLKLKNEINFKKQTQKIKVYSNSNIKIDLNNKIDFDMSTNFKIKGGVVWTI